MGIRDERITAYIANSAPFAQPILSHLRELVHSACPEVEETIKWGMPHFEYAGGILCSMAAFKQHCAFGFWKGSLMSDPFRLLNEIGKTAMGNFGRIESLADLPSDEIIAQYIAEAVRLNKEGIKLPVRTKTGARKPDLPMPDYLIEALKENPSARENFSNFSPSARREYIEWLLEAKSDAVREKRLATALEWISEGKTRHWKYKK